MLRAASLLFLFTLATLAPAAQVAAAPARSEPLPYIEVVTGGAAADAELPLVVALHGRGDTPEGFAPLFRGFTTRARVVIPRPPRDWPGGGYAWFVHDHNAADRYPAMAADLRAVTDRVVATADAVRAKRPTRGRAVVMGFSQGGMTAWAVALRHPNAFAAAFPVAGFLVPELLGETSRTAKLPPIVAFHGTADTLVTLADDRRGARLLEQRGVKVDLRVYDGVGHDMPPKLRADLFAAMAAALPR
jgi:phospholipase/carboxylesterase